MQPATASPSGRPLLRANSDSERPKRDPSPNQRPFTSADDRGWMAMSQTRCRDLRRDDYRDEPRLSEHDGGHFGSSRWIDEPAVRRVCQRVAASLWRTGRLSHECRSGRAPVARRSCGRAQSLSQAKEEPPRSGSASVVAAKLHMHYDVGVCRIGRGELSAVLPLRHEREHPAQPAARSWNGRKATVLARWRPASARRSEGRSSSTLTHRIGPA